jgi:ribosomal-protein-alanine N-acetyltransferase
MPHELDTERLHMRAFTAADFDVAYEVLDGDPDVWRYDPGYQRSKEQRTAILARYALDNEENGLGTLAVILKATGALIGYVGLQAYVWPREPVATPEVELYYKFGRAYWGQGYAQEACREMLRFAFDEMHLARIVTITDHRNTESIRLLARLGMRLEPAGPHWPTMLAAILERPPAADRA